MRDRWGRRKLAGVIAGAALACTSVGCEPADNGGGTEPTVVEPGSTEGVEELAQPLSALAATPVFDLVSSVATLTVNIGDGEVAIISKRVVDSAILVNGYEVVGTGTLGLAKTTNVKKIDVTGSSGANTLIMDYLNGTFAKGTATAVGVTFAGVGGTNALKIRGSSAVEDMVVGADGIAIDSDAFKDITYTGTVNLTFTLLGGADRFSAQGTVRGTGAALTTGVVVFGGDGNDVLTGGEGGDELRGGTGDDVIKGGGGNDDLFGEDGNDTLTGEAGDDALDGGAGNDTLNESSTSDGAGKDTLIGGAGTDTVTYAARTAALTITAGAGANDGESSEDDDVGGDIEVITCGTGDDSVTAGNTVGTTINGGVGVDTLTGGTQTDILNGEAGNDILNGAGGTDTLNGGDGDDTFVMGTVADGADVINGGAGIDLADYSGRSNDLVISLNGLADDGESAEGDNVKADVENVTGGGGGDTITGSALANELDGGAGIDTLHGLAGNDILTGGAGTDTLNGGDGDDIFDMGAAADGADVLNGGNGTDLADYSGRSAVLTITIGDAADDGASGENDDVQSTVENVWGGSGNDTITGSEANNELVGGAGNDTLNGGGGDDILEGGAGNDTLDCGAGDGDIGLTDGDDILPAVGCEL